MQIDFPYGIDGRGRTALTGEEDHVRDLIEQVLFTAPGERVNRPTFGSGVLQLLFAPNGEAIASAVQFTVQGALQQYLGDLIMIETVDVVSQESSLFITVKYVIRRSQQRRTAQFSRLV